MFVWSQMESFDRDAAMSAKNANFLGVLMSPIHLLHDCFWNSIRPIILSFGSFITRFNISVD